MKNFLNLLSAICFAFLFFFFCGLAYAQNVGINTDGSSPDESAILDIKSTDKGVLIPRVALTGTTNNTPIGAGIQASLLVYNTATVSDVTPGFYYWDGSAWTRFVNGTASSGTVTSIDTGAGLTGGPITGSGTVSMAEMPENTIKGNNTNATAIPVDIAVGTNTVLGRKGGDIVADQVITAQIANGNVTTVKIANANVTNAKLANMDEALIKGRAAAAGTGVPQDLTAAEVRTILNVADGATANAGTVTSIATGTGLTGGAITASGTISMADMAALSVKGNATNAVAAPTDIVAGADHRVLRRSGTAIGFGAINLASANAVTGTLPVGNGGTGTNTLTANNLLVGSGTSAVNFIAPGTSGNVLVSNGTSWTSGNGAGSFIRNQSAAVQNPGTFWIQGVGRVGDGTAAAPSLSFNSSAGTGLYRAGANILGFSTDGVERMRILANGQVCIARTTASTANNPDLTVDGNITMDKTSGSIHTITGVGRMRISAYGNTSNESSDGDDILFMTTTSNTNRLIIKNSGRIGIGDNFNNPPNRLSVKDRLAGYVMRVENTETSLSGAHVIDCVGGGSNGDIFIAFRRTSNSNIIGSITRATTTSVAYNTSSDIRLKENIIESVNGLSIINKLRVVDYNYIEDNRTNRVTGFIAQEAYEVIPSVVHKGGDDVKENPWGIDYGKLTPYLTKAIQEQQAMIEELQTTNANQQEVNAQLMEAIEALKEELKALKNK